MPAHTLIVRHVKNSDPHRFTVSRVADGDSIAAAEEPTVAPPNSVRVEGRPNDDLTSQLRWYLEDFLDCPFNEDVEYSERLQAALRGWGKQTFDALFGAKTARDFYRDATRDGMGHLTVRIVSDNPFVLGWPWEALEDSAAARLAQQCMIERRTEAQSLPPKLGALPTDCVNVLLVIARPRPGDVKYRSVARSLVELAADHEFPVAVYVLRPPTLDGLRKHLEANPNRYHILHFDGHGTATPGSAPLSGGHAQRTADGKLAFETADGKENPVEAETLSDLLREHKIPAVVLNACQSGMIDPKAADPFASVAAALLKAGTRSVVAMAYKLNVSGAKQFLPAFYGSLFKTGLVSASVRAGRQQMLANRKRVCPRGVFPIDDWLVPVVYQQEPFDFRFVAGKPAAEPVASRLPEEALDHGNPYGFVGRDGAILSLERAMHRGPAAVVISGLGGVGKTTLAKGFLRWLEQTGGFSAGALWFNFRTIRSAEYVLNRIGEELTKDAKFAALGTPEKLTRLAGVCKKTPLRMVWDNFESAKGVPGTGVTGNLSDDDVKLLGELLARLRNGATKVLITSRSDEGWLGASNAGVPVALGGLEEKEERWEFANAVLDDLGLKQDPQKPDPNVKALVDLLKGHPLAMRVVLSKLATHTAAELRATIVKNLADVLTGDDSAKALTATLRFATESLPAEWQPILVALGLHEDYADANQLEAMAEQVEGGPSRAVIDACLTGLGAAGLVRDLRRGLFELHPLLTSHLRTAAGSAPSAVRDGWTRAFVDVLARLADDLGPRPLHEQREPFSFHEGNFHAARSAAERLGMDAPYAALTQSLGFYAQNTHNYPAAAAFYDQLQAHYGRTGDEKGQAAACHQLGRVAEERRDLETAEGWYRRSLTIKEQLGDEHGAAKAHHHLGRVAEERRDFDTADGCYRRAVEVFERLQDEHGAAKTYHHLGTVAQERRDWGAAERWYRKSLAINVQRGEEREAAQVYHQLGTVAQERRDFDAAKEWYRKSLTIRELLGDERGATIAYHQLGMIAQELQDWSAADGWYRRSLAIQERLGDERRAAKAYHQLGAIAQERQDWSAADGWYHKSLAITERLGDEHEAASSYNQLGAVAHERRDFETAWAWMFKSLAIFTRLGDEHRGGVVVGNLARSFRSAPAQLHLNFLALASQAGLMDELFNHLVSAANSPTTRS